MAQKEVKYNQRIYYAANDRNFESVELKSEVWNYFKRNAKNECRCSLCGAVYLQLGQSTKNLFKHLNFSHGEEVFGFYRVKKIEEDVLTDFLEDITAKGYPTQIFLEALMRLYNCYEKDFQELVERSANKMVQARQQIDSVLSEISLFTDKEQAKDVLRQSFPHLSQGACKELLEENFWMFKEDTDIIQHLEKFGYKIHTQCEGQNIYSNMVLVTNSMKKAYSEFGDTMAINHIDKVFKKRSPKGFDEFSCWYFTGLNQNLQVILFGFALMSQACVANYEFVLKTFFNEMENSFPFSICTPQLNKLQETLQSICPDTMIITNWYHKLRVLKQCLSPQKQKSSILKDICEMLETPSIDEYYGIMSKIRSKIADQEIIKYGIDIDKEKHCISSINKLFIGFGIEPRQYLQIEKMVRESFIYQENLARLFIFVLELEIKVNNREKPKNQRTLGEHHSQFQSIYGERLLARWKQSMALEGQLTLNQKSPTEFFVYQEKQQKEKQKIYQVNFNVEYDHWVCNCGYLELTGLPCNHLIPIIEQHKGSIIYYINPRWKIPESTLISQEGVQKRGKRKEECL